MEKMLFNTEDKKMFEVLQKGGGPNHNAFTIDLWSNEENKWTKTHISFTTPHEYKEEQIIEIAKSNIDRSKYR